MPISYKTAQEYIEFTNKTAQEYTVNSHCMAKKKTSCALKRVETYLECPKSMLNIIFPTYCLSFDWKKKKQ